jgi:hypothetical protein
MSTFGPHFGGRRQDQSEHASCKDQGMVIIGQA